MTRTIVLGMALAILATLVALPTASARPAPECPTLPLWDATFCWAGVALREANEAYVLVTCDVVGGPACGLAVDLCKLADVCATNDDE